MRITHVFHNYYPILGGMERAVQQLAEEQAKYGHEVHLITSIIKRQRTPNEESINGVRIHRVESVRLNYADLTCPIEVKKQLLSDSDVVHCHGQNSLFSLIFAQWAKRVEARLIFSFLSVETLNDHPNILVKFVGSFYARMATKKAIEISDLILVRNLRDQKILKEKYKADSAILPDGLPEYYFNVEKESQEEFRAKFDIKQDKFFLFIGRLHELKGPHILIKALRNIREDVAVVFIGPDGGFRREVMRLSPALNVDSRVRFLGCMDERTKIQAIDSSVALVVPSISNYVEAYSLVMSEAWARGKPVIASKVGALPYRARDNVNGFLIEPSSPNSLANAMIRILDNPEQARKMGINGRNSICAWTWKEVASKSIKYYMLDEAKK